MRGSGEQPEWLVENASGGDLGGELPRRQWEGAEGHVDRARADAGDRRVEIRQRHDIEFGPGMCPVEGVEHARRCERVPYHVHAQRPPAHGGCRPFHGEEEFVRVRQERPPVDGEYDSLRGAVEQAYAEVPFESGDALGDGLLRDRQFCRRFLELPGVRRDGEGADGVEVHGARP